MTKRNFTSSQAQETALVFVVDKVNTDIRAKVEANTPNGDEVNYPPVITVDSYLNDRINDILSSYEKDFNNDEKNRVIEAFDSADNTKRNAVKSALNI